MPSPWLAAAAVLVVVVQREVVVRQAALGLAARVALDCGAANDLSGQLQSCPQSANVARLQADERDDVEELAVRVGDGEELLQIVEAGVVKGLLVRLELVQREQLIHRCRRVGWRLGHALAGGRDACRVCCRKIGPLQPSTCLYMHLSW